MEVARIQHEKEKNMTLFKQLALVVSLIIIIMLSTVMLINYNLAKKNMLDGLYETTVNNISSLSNKLAQSIEEESYIKTIIDAEFDSGYYQSIIFKSNDGSFHYKQSGVNTIENVPDWFIEFSDIELPKVTSDISNGWNIIGEVTVIGDTSIVYKTLYDMFIKLAYILLIFILLTLIILSILLYYILKPLKQIKFQAEAILNNQFVLQEKEPYTQELKEVVKAMNIMVTKVEDIFNRANDAAKKNSELLYNDPVTKLYNRRYLLLKIPDLIKMENKINGGVSIFMALSSVELLSKKLGQNGSRKYLFDFAQVLNNITKNYDDKVIARVNEREFALLISSCEADDASDIVRRITKHFEKLLMLNNLNKRVITIDCGIYRYTSKVTKEELLKRTDSALVNAIAKENDNSYLYEEKDSKNALGKDQWHTILQEAIHKNYFHTKFWSVVNVKTKKINHKVMTFTIITEKNEEYYFGDFIAPAINFELVSRMYEVVIQKLLNESNNDLDGEVCSIRLSNEFIKDVSALDRLSQIFQKSPKNLNFKLSFEMSNNFVIKNQELVQSFVTLFKKYGFGFGVNMFNNEANDFRYLKQLNPNFIKSDVNFLIDQSSESMESLHLITNTLGIEIIATSVCTEEEISKLCDMNVRNVQGRVTEIL